MRQQWLYSKLRILRTMGRLGSQYEKWSESLAARGRNEVIWIGSANVISAVSILGIAIMSARQLGPSQRGEIVLVVAVAMIAAELASLGTNSVSRMEILSKGNVHIEDYLAMSLGLCVPLAVLMAFALTAFAKIGNQIDIGMVPEGVLLGVAMLLGNMLVDGCYAVRRPGAVGVREILIGVLPAIPVFVLWLDKQLTAERVVLLLAVGQLVGNFYMWREVRKVSKKLRFRLRAWLDVISRSIPIFITNISERMAFRSDRLLVGILLSSSALGIYSVAATAAEMPRILLIPASKLVSNRIAAGEVGPDRILRLVARILVPYWLLLFVIIVIAPNLILQAVGKGYTGLRSPLIVMAVAEAILGIYLMAIAVLIGLKRYTRPQLSAGSGALVLITATIVFAPTLGLIGMSVIRLTAFSAMAIVALSLLTQEFQRLRPGDLK